MEYVSGIKVSRVEELRKQGLDPKVIARAGARSVLTQIFMHGFFHGDPHPGNVFVAEDGTIWYLDFGIMGRLDDARREEMLLLFTGFLNRDPDRIIRGLITMGAVADETDTRGLRREIADIVDRYHGAPLGEIALSEVIQEELEAMRRFRLRIPADLSLLARALITTEGVGLILDPTFNLTTEIRPFAAELMRRRLRPREVIRTMRRTFSEMSLSLREAPRSLDTLLRTIQRGYVNIAFEHKGLHDLTSTIDKSSNRIAFGLIVAALLISSALIMVAGKGPLLYGFPALGVIGYVVSGVLGVWLVISILRGGIL